jgi:tetratricopeptide (TPR) repeat protein
LNNTITVAEALASAIQHFQSGQLGEAEKLCRQIIAAQPQHADALHLLGTIAYKTQHHEAALKLFGRAIALKGDAAHFHNSLANVLLALKRIPEAAQSYRRAIEIDPALALAHCGLGQIKYDNNDFAGAAESFQTAISHAPNLPAAHARFANALFQLGRLEEAIDFYRRAVALNPGDTMSIANLGLALQDLGFLDEAIQNYEQALALRPDFPSAHNNLSLALMLKGDFENGLQHHEWRWRVNNLRIGGRRFDRPAWRGEPLNGGRILLHAEQGAGDTLQLLRYAPMVAARGGRVFLEVPADLKRIAMSVKDVEQVIGGGEALPDFDHHCPLLSLPLAFGTTLLSIPGEVPYLAAPEPLRADWQARLSASPHPRVGLVWAGRPQHRRDRERSITLAALAPLADTGATFFALQKGPPAEQAKTPPAGLVLQNLGESFTDYTDTAAAMSALDLVISVDTSPVHLAGAIGMPVWVMLIQSADWRWGMDREDNLWYPTARLFRQPARGDWTSVIARVAAELRRYVAGDVTALAPAKSAKLD